MKTIQKELTVTDSDYRTLPTNRYVLSLDNDNLRKEEFDVLFSRFSQEEWSHMITVTFSRPVTDIIVIEKFCGEYKKRLFKSLYGVSKKYNQIKILTFIESHNEFHKNKKKYHLHILVTYPHEMRETLSRYKFMYEDTNQFFKKILDDVLQKFRGSEFVLKRCPVGDQYDIRPVDSSTRVVDYCLKEYRSGRPQIGWSGTNISWTN